MRQRNPRKKEKGKWPFGKRDFGFFFSVVDIHPVSTAKTVISSRFQITLNVFIDVQSVTLKVKRLFASIFGYNASGQERGCK